MQRLFLILAFILSLSFCSIAETYGIKAVDEQLKSAKDSYSKKNYAEALHLFRELADQGNAEAQYYLGEIYFFGNGVEKDSAEAIKWYERSANQGDANAQNQLGYLYRSGRDVEQNLDEAKKWFLKSADQGNSDAMFELGETYRFCEQNFPEAAKWYRKSAEQGESASQYSLAEMYELGEGVDKSFDEACKWYEKAADNGNYLAKRWLRKNFASKFNDKEITVTGQIVDKNGEGIRGARVYALEADCGCFTVTGTFSLYGVPEGTGIKISCTGFEPQTIEVDSNNCSNLRIVLKER